MPKIPGSFNGGIPPNLKWDPLNPPLKCNNCEMVGMHLPGCDGSYGKSPLRQSECELLNENREWARLGMSTSMVTRDFFKMGNQVKALISILKEMIGEDGQEVLNEEYRKCTIEEMKKIREANQDEIKRQNLGLPPSQVLGPNGTPL